MGLKTWTFCRYIGPHLLVSIKVTLTIFCIAILCFLTFRGRSRSIGKLHAGNSDLQNYEANNIPFTELKKQITEDSIPPGYKSIFYATKLFGNNYPAKYHTFTLCQVQSCVIIGDQRRANAVVYHGTDLSIMTRDVSQLRHARKQTNQVWVFFEKEPPNMHYESLHHLDLFNGLFNWTATYKKSSDLHTGYGTAIRFKETQMLPEQIQKAAAFHKKNKFGVIVTGNCLTTETDKWQVLLALKKRGLQIDILGRCTNRSFDKPLMDLYQHGYKFYFAFHNSRCRDYTSEKIWGTAYKNNLVPVILGGINGKNLASQLPPRSYIHIHDFKTTQQLADYLAQVNNNKTLYESFFAWKSNWRVYSSYSNVIEDYNGEYIETQNKGRLHPGRELDLVCGLCKALHNTSKMAKNKLEHKLNQFWSYKNDCNRTQLKID